MLKEISLIITIALSISLTSQESLTIGDASAYINGLIKSNLDNLFKLEQTFDINNIKVSTFTAVGAENANGHATHALSVSLNNDGKKIKATFKTAKSEIAKTVESFEKEDWEVQVAPLMKLFKVITSKMTPEDYVSKWHFFIIEDIRERLAKSITEDKDLSLKKVEIENGMRYEIYSKESILASVDIKVEDRDSEYFMKATVNVSRQQKETKEFDIKMITRDPQDFEGPMQQIINMLNFKEYFNTNSGNYNKIKEFFDTQKDFQFIPLQNDEVNHEDGTVEKKFNLKFENDIIECSTIYIPPKDLLGAASYILRMIINGKNVDFPAYHNMLKSDLLKHLEGLKIRDYFKSVKEEIFEIFKNKYDAHYSNKIKDSDFNESTRESLVQSKQYILEAKKGNVVVAYIIFSDVYGKISLVIETKKGLEVTFNYEFKKDKFKKSIIEDIIGFLMKSGAAKYNKEVL